MDTLHLTLDHEAARELALVLGKGHYHQVNSSHLSLNSLSLKMAGRAAATKVYYLHPQPVVVTSIVGRLRAYHQQATREPLTAVVKNRSCLFTG